MQIDHKMRSWYNAMVRNGHTPVLKKDQVSDLSIIPAYMLLDFFAVKYNTCNGPACSACNEGWCWHHDSPDEITQCPATKKQTRKRVA